MEYRQYMQWSEGNHLPAMEYIQWECGWFMRGMEERRDQVRQGLRVDVITGQEDKGVERNVAQDIDLCASEQKAKEKQRSQWNDKRSQR